MKKPIITQTFDPSDLDAGDPAIVKIWNLSVKEQNAAALANQDVLIVHAYAGTAKTAVFAERYSSCMVKPSSLGGEGGGFIGMPIDVTLGGTRKTGTAAISGGAVTFTED
nr:MAG TPA: helicase UvrD/REP helicase N-terminal domain [Caudoviricetes sp.]